MAITWELIRREFQALSETYEIRICILKRSPDDSTFKFEKYSLNVSNVGGHETILRKK